MSISAGMIAGGVAVLALACLGAGFVLGLWVGERGRRRDIQWFTGLQGAPATMEEAPDLVEARSADLEALERAEISAVVEGLKMELQRDGRAVPGDKELRAEAIRIVSQYHVEPAADL